MKISKPGEHQAWVSRYRGKWLTRAAMVRSKRRRGKPSASVEAIMWRWRLRDKVVKVVEPLDFRARLERALAERFTANDSGQGSAA